MDNTTVIALPPDRPNVYLDVINRSCTTVECDLEWVALAVENEQQNFRKTVVFCKSINAVADVYEWFMDRLGKKAFVQGAWNNESRLVSVFHAISDTLHQYVMTEFRKPNSTIRVVIATVAFGLGIWWFTVGKCHPSWRTGNILGSVGEMERQREPSGMPSLWKDTDSLKQMKAQSACVRQTVLDTFMLSVAPSSRVKLSDKRVSCQATTKCYCCACALCTCCSYCRHQCCCRRNNNNRPRR